MSRKRRDIQNILAVLSTAFICAILLALSFIYYYGPTGRYLAENTLLDPGILKDVQYQDIHPGSRSKLKFVFDHIDVSYYDLRKGHIHKRLTMEEYQKFYSLVASEKSLKEITNEIQDVFLNPRITLTINVRAQENSLTKNIQEVQFVKEDYFRVKLFNRGEGEEWAYFYRPNIYRETIQILNQ